MNETEKYLALVEERKAKQTTLELKMPSGAVWKYTPFSLAQYAVEGRMPMHLIAKLKSVKNLKLKNFTENELAEAGLSMLTITRDIMLNNLIFPRISLEPADGCILPTQIDPEDFEFFKEFIQKGGQADANLKS